MDTKNLILKSITYLSFTIITGSFCVLVFVSSMPYSTLTPNYKVKRIVNTLMPEGWSFFTKSPREEMADIYLIEDHKITKLSSSNGEIGNVFGLSRKSRKVGMELSIVANSIADSAWSLIPKVEPRFIADQAPMRLQGLNNLHHLRSGTYLISRYDPVPWAWAEISDNLDRKLKYALVTF